MTVDDYKIGDRVRNLAARGINVGVVDNIRCFRGSICVVVKFPPGPTWKIQEDWFGAYDNDWLRVNRLEKLTR